MNNIITTIKKELRSILRDKKTIAVFFVYPIMIPVMIMLYGTMYDNLENEETQKILAGLGSIKKGQGFFIPKEITEEGIKLLNA